MSRSRRMQPVQQAVNEAERQRAERLAESEKRVADSEHKLEELQKYRADYQNAFNQRVSGGINNAGLRDYRSFLAKLNDAVRQQTQIVATARAERDAQRQQWQQAAQRAKSIDNVVEQWRDDERRTAERREQRDSDERAQRPRTALDHKPQ
jgi:flagellar protein FliJ